MIKLNLLPDVKQKYLKAQRQKSTIMFGAVIVSMAMVLMLTIVFVNVRILEVRHLNNLKKDNESANSELKNKQNVSKILTIQNQLNALPQLHEEKVASSRIFSYLIAIAPENIVYNSVSLDLKLNTIKVQATAENLPTSLDKLVKINEAIDTVKFAKFKKSPTDTTEYDAFKDSTVVTESSDNASGSFAFRAEFNPEIFSFSSPSLELFVPNQITTRSRTEVPLFNQSPTTTTEGAQ